MTLTYICKWTTYKTKQSKIACIFYGINFIKAFIKGCPYQCNEKIKLCNHIQNNIGQNSTSHHCDISHRWKWKKILGFNRIKYIWLCEGITLLLKHLVIKPEYFWITKPIPWLLMPGSLCPHGISGHGIEYVGWLGPYVAQRKILITLSFQCWEMREDANINFMVSERNSAWQGLTHWGLWCFSLTWFNINPSMDK